MPRARSNIGWLAVVLAILLLLAGYMGSYYGMLCGHVYLADTSAVSIGDIYLGPEYRFEHGFVRSVLSPAHQIDRWLRPDHWELHPPVYPDVEPSISH